MATQQKAVHNACPARFLVSSPHVSGSAYGRQIIYVLEHNQAGAAGLLLDDQFQAAVRELRLAVERASRWPDRMRERVAALPVTAVNWPAGQLEKELECGIWMKGPQEFDRVFGDYDDLWLELVQTIGRSVLSDCLHIQNITERPWLN